jgi:hypothetical protein
MVAKSNRERSELGGRTKLENQGRMNQCASRENTEATATNWRREDQLGGSRAGELNPGRTLARVGRGVPELESRSDCIGENLGRQTKIFRLGNHILTFFQVKQATRF